MPGGARSGVTPDLDRRRAFETVRAEHPPDVVLFADATILCSGPDGSIEAPGHGLVEAETRLLSSYRLTVEGSSPRLLGSAIIEPDHWRATSVVRLPGGTAAGPRLPQDVLAIAVDRSIGPGLCESIVITNHSRVSSSADVRIQLAADLADSLEIGRGRDGPPDAPPVWDPVSRELRMARSLEGPRGTVHRTALVHVDLEGEVHWRDGALVIPLSLAASTSTTLSIEVVHVRDADPVGRASAHRATRRRAVDRRRWRAERMSVRSDPPGFGVVVERAIEDLFALRDRTLEEQAGSWVVSAGVPSFTGVFGRDLLTSGWQAALCGPELMRGALGIMARTQATATDPWRDAEPGKLIHEQRRGPLGESGLSPRDAYYGSHTGPALFLLALSEAWHWTGDDELLRQHRATAERAMRWAEEFGDADKDGFLEYVTRSPQGLRNQAWKDSGEAIRYPDGSIVPVPIATVEEQAFHILALERLAEVFLALGDDAAADRHLELAARRRIAWHRAYWQEDLAFYAIALDDRHRPVRSIASNAGHALGAGVVPRDVASRLVHRLLEPDLFSGWGVRTLSSAHPSYNPYAYHLGSVWPVENATFALGCKRYGLDAEADLIIEGLVSAAIASPDARLPEALAGLPRTRRAAPVPYPGANAPQAWSASATVQLVQVVTGMYPMAPLGVLGLVRPRLPSWIDVLEIQRVRVGSAQVSLRFERRADGTTHHEVTDQAGFLRVLPAPPPQVVDDTSALEAVEGWVIEHLPGREGRLARIALGIEGERAKAGSVEGPDE